MKIRNWICAITIALSIGLTKTYNILGIFPYMSKSHDLMTQRFVEVLASRGHQITIVTPFHHPFRKNIRQVDTSEGNNVSFIDAFDIVESTKRDASLIRYIPRARSVEKHHCENVHSNPHVKRILNSPEEAFDVVIVETDNVQCYLAIADKYDAPVILLLTVRSWQDNDHLIGNPADPSYIPGIFSKSGLRLNFFQRLANAYEYCIFTLAQRCMFDQDTMQLTRQFLPNARSLDELKSAVAFAFYNNHLSIFPRPYTPNSADIAGLHISKAKALPQHLQSFLDKSVDGAIYFSLGSSTNMSSLSKEKAVVFLEAFGQLRNIGVLWRYDNPFRLTLPENVKLGSWFPQRDILEHKNVKLFISHGGLMSLLEATHCATPILGIPLRLDQHSNLAILKDRGVANLLPNLESVTKENLLKYLKNMLESDNYGESAKRLSQIFSDRLFGAEKSVIYWTEYVIRHKGAKHLRTKAIKMPHYQYLMLDVIAFLSLIIITLSYALIFIVRILFLFVCSKLTKRNRKLKMD